jgi:single-strand selective monofunctional uracil DNA glycosylase
MNFADIADQLSDAVEQLAFAPPVTHVYNPLRYARAAYDEYVRRYANPPKEIVLLGMNPGPWGMAQTGVPFGEVTAVRQWLGIETHVGKPAVEHPKKPVSGFACTKSEVSGRRLWGWARNRFGRPEKFFDRFFVANYCPLLFMESGGRNRTPDRLRAGEKNALFPACDRALLHTVALLQPRLVLGVGKFARDRATAVLAGFDVAVGGITHPSPANPKANRGWEELVTNELAAAGVQL